MMPARANIYRSDRRRALTFVELLLGIAITAIVATAIAGMMGAVTTGMGSRNDARTIMTRSNAAQSRLATYISSARCVLDYDAGGNVVLWLDDSRAGETVHTSEIRWLSFDATEGTYSVSWLQFPDAWSQALQDLNDAELASSTDWSSIFNDFETKNMLQTMPLIDGVTALSLTADDASALNVRHLTYTLSIDTESAFQDVQIAATIRVHRTPAK